MFNMSKSVFWKLKIPFSTHFHIFIFLSWTPMEQPFRINHPKEKKNC